MEIDLAAAAPTLGSRGDRGGLELLEVLEHLDHGVAGGSVGLAGDGAPEAEAELGAELGLDQTIGPERFLGVIGGEVRLAAGGCDPDRGEGCRAAAGLRHRELFDRDPEALAHQRDRRQSDEAIIVIVDTT
jgi:hypothetical protein